MPSALTLLEAAKRTQNELFQSMAASIVTTDEMAAVLPFKTFNGQAAVYLREGTLPDTQFIGDDGTLGSPSTGTDDLVTAPVRRIASDLDVDALADDLSGGSQMGIQIAKKAKATWRLVKNTIAVGGNVTSHTLSSSSGPFTAIDEVGYGPWVSSARFGPGEIRYTNTGTKWAFRAPGDPAFGDDVVAATDGYYVLKSFNASKWIKVKLDVSDASADGRTSIEFASSTNEFDGLNKVLGSSMLLPSTGTDGDIFTFAKLDELITMEKVRNTRAFIMNSKLILKYLAALRATGAANPEHLNLPGYSGPVISYRGIPILENDYITNTESKGSATSLSSVYLASLDADEGLFMGVPGTGTESIDVQGDPRSQVVMGWRIERLGALEGRAHRRTRVQWYGTL
ncbi:MAG TPA: hypothetical protein VLJ42_10400, partial [Solirubrobacteraceae bacterium]|nr:hypothetical protein [Solirubrobacteraceae bacterium]